MRFTKMHGSGNDYVYVDCFRQPLPRDPAGLSRAISDRHFGVGGDGLILICPSEQGRRPHAHVQRRRQRGRDVRQRRPLRRQVRLRSRPRPQANPMTVETGRGVLTLELEVERRQGRAGPRRHGRADPRSRADSDDAARAARRRSCRCRRRTPWHGLRPRSARHLRLDGQSARRPLLPTTWPRCRWSGSARCSKTPPSSRGASTSSSCRCNRPDEVTMRTWERGSGITLACGTGACAVAVAGVLTGRTQRQHHSPTCPAATCNCTGPRRTITCT